MRIKFLKPVPGAAGKSHQPGEFLIVDDPTVARQYIDLGYAEDAPEPENLSALVTKTLTDALNEFKEGVKNAAKSFGPNIGEIRGGESEDDRRKSFGHFSSLVGIVGNNEARAEDRERANAKLKNLYNSSYRPWGKSDYDAMVVTKAGTAQIEGSGPLGGYGVFPEYSTNLYKIAIENTIFASKARRQPMTSNTFFYPKLDQTSTQATGVTGYLGGIVLWWGGEASNIKQTNALLKQGELKAGKLQGYTQISMETIADNQIGLEAQITELIRDGVGYYVDYATLVGDGVDKPLGVINAPSTLQVTRSGGAATQTISYNDLTGMKRRLLPQYRKGAFLAVTLGAEDALWDIKDLNDRPLFLPNANPTMGPLATDVGSGLMPVLGMPYEVTEKLPTFGSTGDFAMLAPQGYLLGERMGLEMAASNAPGFLTGVMTYRFVARVAGQPILDLPFTLIDGVTQASTSVVLV